MSDIHDPKQITQLSRLLDLQVKAMADQFNGGVGYFAERRGTFMNNIIKFDPIEDVGGADGIFRASTAPDYRVYHADVMSASDPRPDAGVVSLFFDTETEGAAYVPGDYDMPIVYGRTDPNADPGQPGVIQDGASLPRVVNSGQEFLPIQNASTHPTHLLGSRIRLDVPVMPMRSACPRSHCR